MTSETSGLILSFITLLFAIDIAKATATLKSSISLTSTIHSSEPTNFIELSLEKGPSSTRISPSCECDPFINKYGKGNCTTKSWAFYGKSWCYVKLPSNCTDLKNSTLEQAHKYSAKACSSKGFSFIYVSVIYYLLVSYNYTLKNLHNISLNYACLHFREEVHSSNMQVDKRYVCGQMV